MRLDGGGTTSRLSSGCLAEAGCQALVVAQLTRSPVKGVDNSMSEARRQGRWAEASLAIGAAKLECLFSPRRQALTLLENHGPRLCSLTFELSCPRRQAL